MASPQPQKAIKRPSTQRIGPDAALFVRPALGSLTNASYPLSQPGGNFAMASAIRQEPPARYGHSSVALEEIRRSADQIARHLQSSRERRNEQQKINDDQWAVSSVSEGAATISRAVRLEGLHRTILPGEELWDKTELGLQAVFAELQTGIPERAAEALIILAEEYAEAQKTLGAYLTDVVNGAELTTTGLKITAAAGAIAATIATGGVAGGAAVPMLGISTGTGLGLLGTSTAIGVGAGVYGLAQETAGQGGEMIAGTREDFDFKKIAMRGGKDTIMGFVGTLTGGALSKYAANYFGRILMQRLKPDQIAALAERLGVNAAELTPAAFLSKAQTIIIDFLSGVATTPLMSAVEVVLGVFDGTKAPSAEEFARMVITNAVEGGLIQLFLAPLMHGASRKPRTTDRSITLGEPVPESMVQSAAETTAELQSRVKSSSTSEPIELPEVPGEMKMQSAAETTAELQSAAGDKPTNVRESIEVPEVPGEMEMQSAAETTAELQSAVGDKPTNVRESIELPKVPKIRKGELQQSRPATNKKVAAASMYKSGKAQTSSYEGAPRRKTPNRELTREEKISERERQLYDTYKWKERRVSADELRRASPIKPTESPPKVGDPDPAFPGQKITALHEDHLVPANKIRKMEGFALLDATTQNQILNTPENLVLVSEKVNTSRGDTPYSEYEGYKREGLTVDPAWKEQMAIREAHIEAMIRERIKQALALRMQLNWRLRFGMPEGYEPTN